MRFFKSCMRVDRREVYEIFSTFMPWSVTKTRAARSLSQEEELMRFFGRVFLFLMS